MGDAACIHCEALRDEVAELRRALGLSGRLSDQRAIQRAFNLTPGQARLVQALYDAGGKVVPRSTLDTVVLTPRGYEDGADSVKVHVSRARAVLRAEFIETADGGYALSQTGRALVN